MKCEIEPWLTIVIHGVVLFSMVKGSHVGLSCVFKKIKENVEYQDLAGKWINLFSHGQIYYIKIDLFKTYENRQKFQTLWQNFNLLLLFVQL